MIQFEGTNSQQFNTCRDDSTEVTPVPIPNTEVKLSHAESSWRIASCEDRKLRRNLGRLAQLGEHLPYKQGVTGSIPVTSIGRMV